MTPLLSMGETLLVNASLFPDKIGARDLRRAMSFRVWNERSCRLANALLGLGLAKGDRVAVLAYNCVEWLEIYAATAKAGLVAVPINFRMLGDDILYILEDCAARGLIVQDELLQSLVGIRDRLSIPDRNLIQFGAKAVPAGWTAYEDLLRSGADTAVRIEVAPEDTWVLMYTSGTTGKPKGAMRSHGSHALLNFVTLLDMGFDRDDTCLLVMPMCHANSLNLACAFASAGATCCVYDRKSFDPGTCCKRYRKRRRHSRRLCPRITS